MPHDIPPAGRQPGFSLGASIWRHPMRTGLLTTLVLGGLSTAAYFLIPGVKEFADIQAMELISGGHPSLEGVLTVVVVPFVVLLPALNGGVIAAVRKGRAYKARKRKKYDAEGRELLGISMPKVSQTPQAGGGAAGGLPPEGPKPAAASAGGGVERRFDALVNGYATAQQPLKGTAILRDPEEELLFAQGPDEAAGAAAGAGHGGRAPSPTRPASGASDGNAVTHGGREPPPSPKVSNDEDDFDRLATDLELEAALDSLEVERTFEDRARSILDSLEDPILADDKKAPAHDEDAPVDAATAARRRWEAQQAGPARFR